MARYLAALLGGGANEHGTVLKPATPAAMFALSSSLIPGYRVWDRRFGVVPPAGIPWSSTRALFLASTRRSWWLPMTESA